MFICTVTKMNLHNKTYMQDNKATLAALTGALKKLCRQKFVKAVLEIEVELRGDIIIL